MMQFPGELKICCVRCRPSRPASCAAVAYAEGAMSPAEVAALASLFPTRDLRVRWVRTGRDHLAQTSDILIVGVDAASVPGDRKGRQVSASRRPPRLSVLVALRHADVADHARADARGRRGRDSAPGQRGRAGRWPSSACWPATPPSRDPARKAGQVVAVLKAGGGVGATSLGVQAAHHWRPRARSGRKDLLCRSRSSVRRRRALFRPGRSPDRHRLPRGGRASGRNPVRHRAGGAQIGRPGPGRAARRDGARCPDAPAGRRAVERPEAGLRADHPGSAVGLDGLDQPRPSACRPDRPGDAAFGARMFIWSAGSLNSWRCRSSTDCR